MKKARVFRFDAAETAKVADRMELEQEEEVGAEGAFLTWEHPGNFVYLDWYAGLTWVVPGASVSEEGDPAATLCEMLLAQGAIELQGDTLPSCPATNLVSLGQSRYDAMLAPFLERASEDPVKSHGSSG